MAKIYYGSRTPINSLNIKHYEVSTNDATMRASDLQSGVTAYARGQKIVGTGKSFEFAFYGRIETNQSYYIPHDINVIEIASVDYPIQLKVALVDMKNMDFSVAQSICNVIVDGVAYEVILATNNNILTLTCDQKIYLQVFYGKDNYT